MAKTLHEILNMSRQRQSEHLQDMTQQELAILFSHLHHVPVEEKDLEDFERFYLAVYSLLREWKRPGE